MTLTRNIEQFEIQSQFKTKLYTFEDFLLSGKKKKDLINAFSQINFEKRKKFPEIFLLIILYAFARLTNPKLYKANCNEKE